MDDMDSEPPIQQGVDKLINMRLSLSEILGTDWKEKSTFSSVGEALKGEGIKTLTDGEKVNFTDAHTNLDIFIVDANEIFTQNKSTFQAKRITDEQGKQKAFIVGKIGEDYFYHITESAFVENTRNGKKIVAWAPNSIGLVSKSGEVLSIDKVLESGRNQGEENTLLFMEIEGRKFRANMQATLENDIDTITLLPENHSQMGTFLHELGHLLRNRTKTRDNAIKAASTTAHNEFDQAIKANSPFNPQAKLTAYETRKLKANEERGAWALGMSLIKDVGRAIGLECASPQAINEMTEEAEQSLKTYDQAPYTFIKHDENNPIPAFSQEERNEARKLHQETTKAGVTYSQFKSFDNDTGEDLANKSHKILEQLKEIQRQNQQRNK